jgi:hypothetical protein
MAWLHDEPAADGPLLPLGVALSGSDHAWSYVFLASGHSRGITGSVTHRGGGIGVKS